ncbi:MAG: cytochrome b/b6 domain-containing protein [Sphingorhabdus sp.]
MKRHRLSTRLWHWTNAAALLILLMSGLMIFNAHPRLYWGQYGANDDSAWLEIGSMGDQGKLRIGALEVKTTGLLGVWKDAEGKSKKHAFPYWATIPSGYDLASARRWHLLFAWVLALPLLLFILRGLFNGHIWRDLRIARAEWSPRHIWQDIKDHARLRFPKGQAALRYNILQKFSYIAVIFILLPLMIFTGLTMSPNMAAAWPWLLDIFGGRQSARSLHFIAAFMLLGFIIIHIVMALLAGPVSGIRSIITGWYRIPDESVPAKASDEGTAA